MSYTDMTRNVIFTLLLVTVFSDAFAQAPIQKKLQLKDVVTVENEGILRVKSGFTLAIDGEDGFVVRSLTKEVAGEIGRVKCGSCPGGRCRPALLGPDRGTCKGCNGGACLLNPF